MKTSKKIALSCICAALGGVCLIFFVLVPYGKLSLLALASVCVMPLLSKNLKGYACLTEIAISLIGLFSGRIEVLIIFGLLFGIHPIINALVKNWQGKSIPNYAVCLAIKLIYVNIMMYVIFFLISALDLFPDITAEYHIIAIIASLLFIVYDFIMQRVQLMVDRYVNRIIK